MMKHTKSRWAASIGWSFVCGLLGGCASVPLGDLDKTQRATLYPAPPAQPRIAFLTGFDSADLALPPNNRLRQFLFGRGEVESLPIVKPYGLAAGLETLLICDTQQSVVHVMNFATGRSTVLGAGGREPLVKPVSVALDETGHRYVADAGRQQIVVFSPDDQPIRSLGGSVGHPFKPVAVACDRDTLLVANGAMRRIERIDAMTGELLGVLPLADGDAQTYWPTGIDLDDQGFVLAVDQFNGRVLRLSGDGKLHWSVGSAGSGGGQFARPRHVAAGPDGISYITDAGFQRVHMYDADGRLLMRFGGGGEAPGSLSLPAGIAVDSSLLPYFRRYLPDGFDAEYLIFVSDQFGDHRINVYAKGHMSHASGSSSTE